MPDLTEHATWWCSTNPEKQSWKYESNSTRGKFYTVVWGRLPPSADTEYGYICDCWPFKKKGTCPHIRWARESHCRWNWEMEVGVEPGKEACPHCGSDMTVCPDCGAPLEAIKVAV
jgi:hypothetical protein